MRYGRRNTNAVIVIETTVIVFVKAKETRSCCGN